MLDRETVERLLQNNLDAKLNSELSKYGYQLDAAHKLFRFITSIFERTPPELITWKFKVIMPVGDWDFSQKIILNFHRMNEVFTSVWGDRIFEKCGIRRDEGGDGGKTLEIRGKRRLPARDRGANYQQS